MRIALFSDIHANLPALEACLKSIDVQRPDAVYCLGDLVGYNVWPNEVINLIRHRGIPVLMGNYDQGIGLSSDDCGCAYKSAHEKEMGKISISYTNSVVNPDERNYLRTLPKHIRLEFQFNNDPFTLLLVHGSPRRINEYLFEEREEKSLLRIIENAATDILCFGHTHKPFHRILQHEERKLHAINTGSVGKPKDSDPRGCYVLLTVESMDRVEVEFVRIEYDVQKAARAIEMSELPGDYADMLRRGA
jgi:putative phosphoesterase